MIRCHKQCLCFWGMVGKKEAHSANYPNVNNILVQWNLIITQAYIRNWSLSIITHLAYLSFQKLFVLKFPSVSQRNPFFVSCFVSKVSIAAFWGYGTSLRLQQRTVRYDAMIFPGQVTSCALLPHKQSTAWCSQRLDVHSRCNFCGYIQFHTIVHRKQPMRTYEQSLFLISGMLFDEQLWITDDC